MKIAMRILSTLGLLCLFASLAIAQRLPQTCEENLAQTQARLDGLKVRREREAALWEKVNT